MGFTHQDMTFDCDHDRLLVQSPYFVVLFDQCVSYQIVIPTDKGGMLVR